MSDTIMKKSYTVMCMRSTGQQMELATVSDYAAAINSAKEALTNSKNTEIQVIENKYDQATRKDKKQVVKIMTRENTGTTSGGGGTRGASRRPGVTREVADKATKGIINIVIAITVLVILAGVMIPLITR